MNFWRIFLVKCLLLLFPGVKCSISKWIYMAVNESALLNITTVTGSIYDATWLKDRKWFLQIKDSKVKYYVNKEQCRCKIFLNGTVQIQQVKKEDSGKYTVTVYQQDGRLKAEEDLMFIVQEPVPQPILTAECRNKTVSVKCEAKQKTKDETFIIELTQGKSKKIQNNATSLEWITPYSGMFRCVFKNNVSKEMSEKVIKCSVNVKGGTSSHVPLGSSSPKKLRKVHFCWAQLHCAVLKRESCMPGGEPKKEVAKEGQLDFYLILSIAGGTIFFVIFMIFVIYCIRKKKAERLENEDEEQMMQARQVEREMVVRELPQPPCNPTPKQLRVQQRPLPQPQMQQHPLPPRPRPRIAQRTPNHPRERP